MSTTATLPDFSTPIYMEEPAATSAGSSASTSNNANAAFDSASASVSDLNALEFQLETNVDVDAYAAPPPIPDGRYRVKLKQIDVKLADGSTGRYKIVQAPDKNHGQPYAFTAIEATILDPSGKFDGLKVWDRFVSTMVARNGGIPMVRILTCLGHKLPAQTSPKAILEMLLKVLASEPELEIETVWEGGLDEADRDRFKQANEKEPRVLGMNKFPDNPAVPGTKLPEILGYETKLGKVNLRAQTRINGYYPLTRRG